MSETHTKNAASFRDPSGFVFLRDGVIYRQVNRVYQNNYDHFIRSGLWDKLVEDGLLIAHSEVELEQSATGTAYKVIEPALIPFISYPYEWCFSQLKDAGLLTLEIQLKALEFGMSLKDCSAYNIQFNQGKPIFIDTLSFEMYREGQPWVAYRQFCQHFLAPLVLMSQTDIRLQQLLRIYIDGVPLDLASSLLPARSWLNFAWLSHIHMHAKSQKQFANRAVSVEQRKVGRIALLGLIDNLKSAIKKLKWRPTGTEWHDYYTILRYSDTALERKKLFVAEMLDKVEPVPNMVWDVGANTGLFSRVAGERGMLTISFDLDAGAVEKNYLETITNRETCILPLVLDLTNPSSGLGWNGQERMSIFERGPADAVLALALIHHLVIANNVPFAETAQFFGRVCAGVLIIEFVPKSDPQVRKLLINRDDIFGDYNEQTFEREFGRYFVIELKCGMPDMDRTLYFMRKRDEILS
jgi:ribosomal protein L11 methylase PrmA